MKILMLKHYWMAVGPGGVADYYMIRSTRHDAINAIQQHYRQHAGDDRSWEQFRRDGWRVVKVRIVPVQPES